MKRLGTIFARMYKQNSRTETYPMLYDSPVFIHPHDAGAPYGDNEPVFWNGPVGFAVETPRRGGQDRPIFRIIVPAELLFLPQEDDKTKEANDRLKRLKTYFRLMDEKTET